MGKAEEGYVRPICPEAEVVFPFVLRLKVGTLSSKEIAFAMLKKTPSSSSKSLHEINFKYLSNNHKEDFKNVPSFLTQKETSLQGIRFKCSLKLPTWLQLIFLLRDNSRKRKKGTFSV